MGSSHSGSGAVHSNADRTVNGAMSHQTEISPMLIRQSLLTATIGVRLKQFETTSRSHTQRIEMLNCLRQDTSFSILAMTCSNINASKINTVDCGNTLEDQALLYASAYLMDQSLIAGFNIVLTYLQLLSLRTDQMLLLPSRYQKIRGKYIPCRYECPTNIRSAVASLLWAAHILPTELNEFAGVLRNVYGEDWCSRARDSKLPDVSVHEKLQRLLYQKQIRQPCVKECRILLEDVSKELANINNSAASGYNSSNPSIRQGCHNPSSDAPLALNMSLQQPSFDINKYELSTAIPLKSNNHQTCNYEDNINQHNQFSGFNNNNCCSTNQFQFHSESGTMKGSTDITLDIGSPTTDHITPRSLRLTTVSRDTNNDIVDENSSMLLLLQEQQQIQQYHTEEQHRNDVMTNSSFMTDELPDSESDNAAPIFIPAPRSSQTTIQ